MRPRMGCTGPRNEWLMGARAMDGHIGSTEGCDNLVECGFTKGHDTPKRHDVSNK
jgi:hypothetical protein